MFYPLTHSNPVAHTPLKTHHDTPSRHIRAICDETWVRVSLPWSSGEHVSHSFTSRLGNVRMILLHDDSLQRSARSTDVARALARLSRTR